MCQEKVLSLQNLSMSYGSKSVLNNINLDVYAGQIIGYIGPNGAGKSTTLKIMLGLIEEYSGTVELFGVDIATSGYSYKRKIGYVPENAELYDNLTANEYLTFIGELYGMDKSKAAAKAKNLMQQFDMEDVLHTRISSFSKGMRQKVLLISSLLHNPDLIFLDEPLNGLDANSVIIIKDILEQLVAEGKTIFYSSHIMEVVEKISNRIVLLKDGEIAADGTFEQLRKQNKQGSLESIFNQITGFDEHKQTAEKFVQIVTDGDYDE
ncbi:ABC transporter ATP-binding protein [Virgibacillus chiguensis]|uniref:ABC-2 type transport system ATP-binding protein n=1 Tax=Virgibacillus chiguensis TaxID=411959 RepID=A0A1M5WXI0_9BACI|nr:ABC transporter ATP-binding protein [Virgibacillus chiguensis]SHH92058.1 ABC-2 type transport system ATP-binding protein [Virgibacillus chiguensis]